MISDADKVKQYEALLHKIDLLNQTHHKGGIEELLVNIYKWSAVVRRDDTGDEDLHNQAIERAFNNLLDTPHTDADIKYRQKKYSEYIKSKEEN